MILANATNPNCTCSGLLQAFKLVAKTSRLGLFQSNCPSFWGEVYGEITTLIQAYLQLLFMSLPYQNFSQLVFYTLNPFSCKPTHKLHFSYSLAQGSFPFILLLDSCHVPLLLSSILYNILSFLFGIAFINSDAAFQSCELQYIHIFGDLSILN